MFVHQTYMPMNQL